MTTQQITATPLIKEVVINAPASKVWDAITDKAKMKEWYFEMSDFKPEVGFTFTFTGCDKEDVKFVHLCEITEVIPNKKLSHSWRYEGYPGNSTVTWELQEEDGKTLVTLTHTGLESISGHPSLARNSFDEGWTHFVQSALKNYTERA